LPPWCAPWLTPWWSSCPCPWSHGCSNPYTYNQVSTLVSGPPKNDHRKKKKSARRGGESALPSKTTAHNVAHIYSITYARASKYP
jgi:hypothetical protein